MPPVKAACHLIPESSEASNIDDRRGGGLQGWTLLIESHGSSKMVVLVLILCLDCHWQLSFLILTRNRLSLRSKRWHGLSIAI